jgi:uncharacterized protein YutE (UPF0331/DUF86 family)
MERIREKIREIEEAVGTVEDNLPETFDAFKDMGLVKDGIYKNVETVIQSCYDICALIVKEERLQVPGDEESIPDLVARGGIISEKMAATLKDMKGFRNALAHKYGRIHDEEAFHNIESGLTDFNLFLDAVEAYLEEKED